MVTKMLKEKNLIDNVYISNKEKVLIELEHIRINNKGLLHPKDIVNYARNKDTLLHNYFEWDDTKAAESYRIWQARQLLRVLVIVEPASNKHINAYVSLDSDREEGGYRLMVDVLSSKDKREELLANALMELNRWRRKYNKLVELAKVFEAIDKVTKERVV